MSIVADLPAARRGRLVQPDNEPLSIYPWYPGRRRGGTRESQLRRIVRRGAARPRKAEITAEDEKRREGNGRRGFPARIAERFRGSSAAREADTAGGREESDERYLVAGRSHLREGDERSKNRMRAPGARALTRALRAGDPPARILRVSLLTRTFLLFSPPRPTFPRVYVSPWLAIRSGFARRSNSDGPRYHRTRHLLHRPKIRACEVQF